MLAHVGMMAANDLSRFVHQRKLVRGVNLLDQLEHSVSVDDTATTAFAEEFRRVRAEAADVFSGWRAASRMLGARPVEGDPTLARIAFWTPELIDRGVPAGDVFIEVLHPADDLDLQVSRSEARFSRTLLPAERDDDVTLAVVRGMVAGSREQLGSFYALVWRDADSHEHRILDPLAASLPFGAFAPAELYDLAGMQAAREDADWFAALGQREGTHDGTPTVRPATSILQVHVPTATRGGTLASLTRHIQSLAGRVEAGAELTAADRLWLGYDAVQLLPVEPTTVFEQGPEFWNEIEFGGESILVDLRRPNTTNWGYDVVIAGSATVNPVMLETGRPDELVDLASALHNFPGQPKKLIFDVVFGHADNQALDCLNAHYLAGANMYGQNLAYRNPAVRAILLEMQRRKVDFGADGVRVDGAQDFKWWDATARVLRHDDDYLREMYEVPQEVAGTRYQPWFIFEDGRPWPQEDWELSSSYRAVTELLDNRDVFQWGPLTFAHNTPFLYTFWLSKLWRIRQIMEWGESWISGCSNHDTLRRGTQVNPELNVNTRLGTTLMEILDKAYDNPAVQMFTYAACPGVPMDFLNASARASWGFVRNQDDRWGVKIVAEEAISLKWQVDEVAFDKPGNFTRLKGMGFDTLPELRRFFDLLPSLVQATNYDIAAIARLARATEPAFAVPLETEADVKAIGRAWMDDMHDFVNVMNSIESLGDEQTTFDHALREFRRERPWLRGNLGASDCFAYRRPVDGSAVFHTHRHGPDGEEVLAVTHMEGASLSVDPFAPDGNEWAGTLADGWRAVLATPGVAYTEGEPVTLHDSTGIVFVRGGTSG